LSIIKHVTLQKIVAHDFRYDPRSLSRNFSTNRCVITQKCVVTINEHYGAIPYLVLTTSLVTE
jgi:hypothetical protein